MRKTAAFFIFLIMIQLSLIVGAAYADTGNISVLLTGFHNDKGRAQVVIYSSDKGFPLDPNYAYETRTTVIKNGQARVVFNDIPMGEYAISAIHDEDMDGDFDRNWLFIPGEGWGTSNDAGGYWGPGSYKDSRFILDSKDAVIRIIMHY